MRLYEYVYPELLVLMCWLRHCTPPVRCNKLGCKSCVLHIAKEKQNPHPPRRRLA